ncbi:MAG TPA: YlxR family protein [Candidatus Limnocylindrales bacterium]|nr:YlxR family protein [Candidatus Limnocylindrales bacterium]
MVKSRKIPLRICISCQEKKPKKELIRVVRTPEGKVILDLTGKKPGRGAYVCLQDICVKKAVKGKRLEKNLQLPITENLIEEIGLLLKQDPCS